MWFSIWKKRIVLGLVSVVLLLVIGCPLTVLSIHLGLFVPPVFSIALGPVEIASQQGRYQWCKDTQSYVLWLNLGTNPRTVTHYALVRIWYKNPPLWQC